MNFSALKSTLLDSLSSLRAQLHAAVQQPIVNTELDAHALNIAPDFKGWLHGDPSVAKNPANRYGERSPGYMTGNGLGSLEIGAADD